MSRFESVTHSARNGKKPRRSTEGADASVLSQPAHTRPCGHERHVGTCGCCQRTRADRHREQLATASALAATQRTP